jgi:hypothetical protein
LSTPSASRSDYSPLPAALDDSRSTRLSSSTTRQARRSVYFYFEDEPGRRSAANLLTRDEARRMVANFAKLPELLRRS